MKKNDIISVVTAAGEFIGKFEDEDTSRLTINDPRMLINTPEGMGFARGVCVSGVENPNSMAFYTGGIVFVAPTNEDIQKSYRQAVSGIIT